MDRHTLEILEFGKIIESISGFCLTAVGAEMLAARRPDTEYRRVTEAADQLREMIAILAHEGDFPLSRVADIRPSILRTSVEEIFLDPKELLAIADFLEVCQDLMKFSKVSADKYPLTEEHLSHLVSGFAIVKRIRTAIDDDGEVRDNASSELKKLRGEMRNVRTTIIERLKKILAGKDPDPAWQEDIITLRNDRFVIPVRTGDVSPREGVIQDRSSTGQTLFVEPFKVIELNNRLRQVMIEERREVEKILRSITRMVRSESVELTENVRVLGVLDSLHARANWAKKTDSRMPDLVDRPMISLVDGRHPLLVLKAVEDGQDPAESVVPITLKLGESFIALVVTGPNTGGKTVSLKTTGLLISMVQAGLPVPVGEGTAIGVFTSLFADIGDEQSIESSLSTFSSHVRQIRHAVEQADENSLVLLDELGAGTDPKEGAALGEAIIMSLVQRNVRVMCTTHYTALKTLSQNDPRIENAAVEFDAETLNPTYRLNLGVPGSSYAIDIARRLGMPEEITERATELMGTQEVNLTGLLAELESTLRNTRQQEAELKRRQKITADLEDLLQSKTKKMRELEKEFAAKALAESEKIIAETKREMERLVREIRESQAEKKLVRETHHRLKKRAAETRQKKEALRDDPPPPPRQIEGEIEPGDRVWVAIFGKEGEVVDIFADRGKVKLRLGNMYYTVDLAHCRRIAAEEPANPEVHPSPINLNVTTDIKPEISLRGLTGEEALEALDRYLDEARLTGWEEVRIIHGKGEGILRRVITEMLKSDKRVNSFHLGEWNEGGLGVTIARLVKD